MRMMLLLVPIVSTIVLMCVILFIVQCISISNTRFTLCSLMFLVRSCLPVLAHS